MCKARRRGFSSEDSETGGTRVCINEVLGDDELLVILRKLGQCKFYKEKFGLVCKRWLRLQSSERKKLCLCTHTADPETLHRIAARFSHSRELDFNGSNCYLSPTFSPPVTDSHLFAIASGFRSLRVLSLKRSDVITDNGMTTIARSLPLLQSLDVSYCTKLTDKGLSAVAEGCFDLRWFQPGGCKFIAAVSHCRKFSTVVEGCCREKVPSGSRLITDGVLVALSKNCCNLQDLGLQHCTNITDSGLVALVQGCRKIKALDLNKCYKVGYRGISSVSQACSSTLRKLNLMDCYNVGDESVSCIAKFCINIETLILSGCRLITDEAIKTLAAAPCSHTLKDLQIDSCLNVSSFAVNSILCKCSNLESLDIGRCPEVTDAAFRGLSYGGFFLGLKSLVVCNCPKITISGLGLLLDSCSALKHLDVSSCPQITLWNCQSCCRKHRLQLSKHFEVSFADCLWTMDTKN